MKRRLFCVLASIAVILVSVSPGAGAAVSFAGDADGSGDVSVEDARLILRSAIALRSVDGEEFLSADVDGNGEITVYDARLALRMAVSLDPLVLLPGDDALLNRTEPVVNASAWPYTYGEMKEDLELLAELAPSRFSRASLAVTADGRDVFCAVLGTGRGSRQIVVDAAIHGSEYLTPAAVMSAVEYYLRHYDEPVYGGKTVRDILRDTDLYIFPMLNPDGVTVSQLGLAGLGTQAAKDRVAAIYQSERAKGRTSLSLDDYLKVWKANSNGVDLNRNWLFDRTGLVYDTGVYEPANEEYAGDRARPEAETAAYRNLVNGLTNPVAALSVHSQGNLIYWNCGQDAAGRAAAKALASVVSRETGYYLDASDSFVGASADWAMIDKKIPAVTIECGRGHNPLPRTEQNGINEALRYVFLAVAEAF